MHRREGCGQVGDGADEHAEDARHIARQEEIDGVFDVGIHAPAVDHRLDDGGEVVVREDHGRGVLADLGAGDAHGHADIGGLEGGGVVDAVAGHGDNAALPLPGPHNADLVLRGHPGVDRDLLQTPVQLIVAHGVQLHAGERLIPVPEDAQLPGNGGGGDLVVAGDHNGADTAPLGVGYGLDGLGPGRVNHGDEAHKGEVPLVLQRQRADCLQLLAGEGEDTQALL